jgi:UDP-N-acetyl-D-glucosamine dehydrogenase
MESNKISIIGLGYVGLPLACSIAKSGKYRVVGLDINKEHLEKIKNGICPIDDEQTSKDLKEITLEVSNDPQIIEGSQFSIICVPTPIKENKLPNLNPIKAATETAFKYLEKGQSIVIESTVNPGVCEEVILPILEQSGLKGGKDFYLSHCPERINPGDKKWNVNNIPRNIGSLSKEGNKHAADFYRSFLDTEINELSCLKSAEASKVVENTFRDINIAYVNELAKSFDLMGIDLLEVIGAASNKPFAFMPHFPGCGVGGHCIPVDPYYLIERAKKAGFEHGFLTKAREINNSMPEYAVSLLSKELAKMGSNIENSNIALLGLTYKGNVSDLRESPALKVKEILESKTSNLSVYDPFVAKLSTEHSLAEVLAKNDVVFIATEHQEFKDLPASEFKKLGIKLILDGKNCLNKKAIQNEGIIYKGIGH